MYYEQCSSTYLSSYILLSVSDNGNMFTWDIPLPLNVIKALCSEQIYIIVIYLMRRSGILLFTSWNSVLLLYIVLWKKKMKRCHTVALFFHLVFIIIFSHLSITLKRSWISFLVIYFDLISFFLLPEGCCSYYDCVFTTLYPERTAKYKTTALVFNSRWKKCIFMY